MVESELKHKSNLVHRFIKYLSKRENRINVLKERAVPAFGYLILAYAWITEQMLESKIREFTFISQAYNQYQLNQSAYSADRQSRWLITTNFSYDSISQKEYFNGIESDSLLHEAYFRLATLEYKTFYSLTESIIQMRRVFNNGVFDEAISDEMDAHREGVREYYLRVEDTHEDTLAFKRNCNSLLKLCQDKTTMLRNKYSTTPQQVDAEFDNLQRGIENDDKNFASFYIIGISCIFGHGCVLIMKRYLANDKGPKKQPEIDELKIGRMIQSTVDKTISAMRSKR